MYTGTQSIHQFAPKLDAVLRVVDEAAAIGITMDSVHLTRARADAARAHQLISAQPVHLHRINSAVDLAAEAWADGTGSVDEVLDAAFTAALIPHEMPTRMRRQVDRAAALVNRSGLNHMRMISETQWVNAARPVVTSAMEAAHRQADEMGITAPLRPHENVRTTRHPWAPSDSDLSDTRTRHRWELLLDALDTLDAAFALLDQLRDFGLIPAVPGRVTREDYRWLRREQLDGDPDRQREFWLANRHHADPGAYTSTQLADHDLGAQVDSEYQSVAAVPA